MFHLRWFVLLQVLVLPNQAQIAAVQTDEAWVLIRPGPAEVIIDNSELAYQQFTPCSTYKITNSLIALDSGAAGDPGHSIRYQPERDGEQHGPWSRDLDLRSAVRVSAAWFFRELARQIGADASREYIDRFDYGNRDISGGADKYWLGSSLRVSPVQQAEFLHRLHENRLGVKPRTTSLVEEMLLLETGAEYRWYGKTGTCTDATKGPVAWHAGWVERGAKTSVYTWFRRGSDIAELFRSRPARIRAKLHQAGLISAAEPSARQQMEWRVAELLRGTRAGVSFAAINLDTGADFSLRPTDLVRTASTIKLPIMAAVFSLVKQGKAKWMEKIAMTDDDKVSGSGVLSEFAAGAFTLQDLVHNMIVVSDNTATNLIIDRFSADSLNEEIDRLGLHQTRCMRKILGDGSKLKAVASGHSREGLKPENARFGLGYSTPADMVSLLQGLAAGTVVDTESSERMLAILQRQHYKHAIGRTYRDDDVWSKSGSLDRLRSDAALLQSDGGLLALSVTVDNLSRTDYSEDNAGLLLISKLSQILEQGLAAPVSYLGKPLEIIPLSGGELDHVQGIDVDGETLYVSSVNRKAKTGHLSSFALSTGKHLKTVSVEEAGMYHPGGLSLQNGSIWLPVAEYRARSRSVMQQRRVSDLSLLSQFPVQDHIGCVAANGNHLVAGNWDARHWLVSGLDGKDLSRRLSSTGTRYQDLKMTDEGLVGGGLRSDGLGAIDILDPVTFQLRRRILTGRTSRGVVFTNEGLAIANGKLYLLPEDGPSRLLVKPKFFCKFNLPFLSF